MPAMLPPAPRKRKQIKLPEVVPPGPVALTGRERKLLANWRAVSPRVKKIIETIVDGSAETARSLGGKP